MPGTTIRVPADLRVMGCASLTTEVKVCLGSWLNVCREMNCHQIATVILIRRHIEGIVTEFLAL
jgi:hypothetical protein